MSARKKAAPTTPLQESERLVIPLRVPASAAPVVARALEARRKAGSWMQRSRGSLGFPWAAPTWPGTVDRPPVERTLGADFETEWARTPAARVARALALDGVMKPALQFMASPTVTGLDRLIGVEGPVLFVSNHSSHFDTPLLLTSLPDRFRHRTVVAAAADYFFDRRSKATVSALALGAIPFDRHAVSRRSLDRAAALLEDGWNLIIFPEGGRSYDGWAQEFKAVTAFLAIRCGVPVVPVHLEGSRRVLRADRSAFKGGLHRATTHVTYGTPLSTTGLRGNDARALAASMEQAVAELADEQATDWWSARKRAAAGTTPSLRGPEVASWRRSWELGEGKRRVSGPRWPA